MNGFDKVPHTSTRWVVVAFVAIVLVILGKGTWTALDGRAPSLGVRLAANGISGQENIIAWVQPAGLAWDAGIRPSDRIISLDGQNISGAVRDIQVEHAISVTVITSQGISVTASSAGARQEADRRRWSFGFLALAFFLVGSLIYLLAADAAVGWQALSFTCSAAIAFLCAPVTSLGISWALAVEYVAVLAFGASSVLLFQVFPIDRRGERGTNVLALTCVVGTAIVVGLYATTLFADSAIFAWVHPLGYGLLVAEFVMLCYLAIGAWSRASARHDIQRALGLLVLGICAGLAPFYLLSLIPQVVGMEVVLPPDRTILSAVLVPASLAAAILGRQFPKMPRLIRRSLVAVLVWCALVSALTLVLSLLPSVAGTFSPAIARALHSTLVVVAVVALAFAPLQQYLRITLERYLFRDTYDYAASLHKMSHDIVSLTTVDAIADYVLQRLGHLLDLRWAALVVDPPGAPDVTAAMVYRWGACPEHVESSPIHRPTGTGSWQVVPPQVAAADLIPEQHVATMLDAAMLYEVAAHVSLIADTNPLGTLVVGVKRHDIELLPEDRSLLSTLAPLVATAMQNALLTHRLEAKVQVLAERERELAALTTRLLQVQEEERRRIALDLHDDPLQRAILLTREASALEAGALEATSLMRSQIGQLRAGLEEIVISLRAICIGIRPQVLDDLGLTASLEWLLNDLSARSELATRLDVRCDQSAGDHRLAADLEVALYRVAQEALANCLKHAGATQVWATLHRSSTCLTLEIADDGHGHGSTPSNTSNAQMGTHLGIVGMRERLRPWGGTVSVRARDEGGTVVIAQVPMDIPEVAV